MNHAFLAGSEFNKCAEFLDADNSSVEHLSFFELRNDRCDVLLSHFHTLGIAAADGYAAVILDVDLDAGALDDLVDGLSALTDDLSDLLRIDLHVIDLGSILVNGRTGLSNCF